MILSGIRPLLCRQEGKTSSGPGLNALDAAGRGTRTGDIALGRWFDYSHRTAAKAAVVVLSLLAGQIPFSAEGATYYEYDPLGRLTTALYDNGLCVVYSYDANGNRTSQTNYETPQVSPALWGAETWGSFVWSSAPQWPVWGSGAVWGCFKWTPP